MPRKKLYRAIVVLIYFIACKGILHSQRYPFTTITNKDGLPQSTINDIAQDHQGYIWMATTGGICRFDGREFENYTYYAGLEASHITDIEFDNHGSLWVSTQGRGIARFDGKQFHVFDQSCGLKYTKVKDILFSSNGDAWISVLDHNLVRISVNGGIKLTEFPEIPHDFKSKKITELKNGDIVIGGKGGYYQLSAYSNFKPEFFPQPDLVFQVAEDHFGGKWIVGRNFIHFKNGDKTIDYSGYLPEHTDVYHVLPLATRGEAICSTTEGLLKISQGKTELIRQKNGLAGDFAQSGFIDSFGNRWIATTAGASIINDLGIVHFNDDGVGGDLKTFSISEDPSGNIWIAKDLMGYFICNDSTIEKYPYEFEAPFIPMATFFKPDGSMYILANFKRIIKMQSNKIVWKWELPDSIARVNSFFPMADNDSILMGTSAGGFILDESSEDLRPIAGMNATYFRRFIKVKDDEIWALAEDRIFAYANGSTVDLTAQVNPKHALIEDGMYDERNKLVWLTTQSGVIVWNGKQSFQLNSTNGLHANLASCITQDKSGRMWIGLVNGMECVDLKNGSIRHYGYEEGFTPIESNATAAITDRKGNVWVGTSSSATRIEVAKIGRDTVKGLLRLKRIWVNEQLFYLETYNGGTLSKLNLKHDQNNLQFDVASLCFTNATKVMYQWKLEAYDKHWSSKSDHREITYANLPPGNYKLMVKAINPNGFETNQIELLIHVEKPFWQRGLFYVCEILIFLLIVFLSFRFATRSEKNRLGQVMTVLTIIILFESLMLYISGYADKYTNGIPVFQLVMNILLAATLYPLENRIKKLMVRSARKIRVAKNQTRAPKR